MEQQEKQEVIRNLYILRGVPGCGKSTLASTLAEPYAIIEFDDFRYYQGEYRYAVHMEDKVRELAFNRFEYLIIKGVGNVVLANTNTEEKYFQEYKEYAESHGYRVFVMTVENRHGGQNVHGLTDEQLQDKARKLSNSIKLLP